MKYKYRILSKKHIPYITVYYPKYCTFLDIYVVTQKAGVLSFKA